MPAERNKNRALCFMNYLIYIIQRHNNKIQDIAMSNDDNAQQILQQIRNLLTQHPHSLSHPEEAHSLSDQQVKQYLTESYRLVQGERLDQNDPNLVHSKISEASVLLSQESSMIKNYVKGKIQSECFGAKAKGFEGNAREYERLMGLRDSLERKRLEEKLEQSVKVNNAIESVRKGRKYQLKSSIPLPQVESYLHRQGVDYENLVKEEHRIKSANNKIIEEGEKKLNFEPLKQSLPKKKSKLMEEEAAFMIQVSGIEEDQLSFMKQKSANNEKKLMDALVKNKSFVAIFSAFLRAQRDKLQVTEALIAEHEIDNTEKAKKRYRFYNEFIGSNIKQQVSEIKMGQLSRAYKFKPFMQQNPQQPPKIKTQPIRKVISKRNGESNKYHMKQCLVLGNTFFYSDEQNSEEEVKIGDMKSIEIQLMPLEYVSLTKEEGGIFQKKEMEIEAVVLKGISRNFTYQLNMAEGLQLTEELTKVNLRRLHEMSCIIGAQSNKDMGKFIESEHGVLNFSNTYIRPQDQYPSKQYRSNFIKMLLKLFPSRKSTHTLHLSKCNLGLNELNSILKQCELHFSQIEKLNFSHTKLDRETVKNILGLVKKCPSNRLAEINFSNCGLDDDVIQANLANFTTVCSKIGVLDLSGNQITGKSLKGLRNIFSSKICEIKTLNLNGCPLEDFTELANMVKTSNKIQKISANECKLTINNQKLIEDMLQSTQQKQQLKKLQLRRNICTGTILWFEDISPFLQLSIDLPIKSLSFSKTLQSKYLRVVYLNNR